MLRAPDDPLGLFARHEDASVPLEVGERVHLVRQLGALGAGEELGMDAAIPDREGSAWEVGRIEGVPGLRFVSIQTAGFVQHLKYQLG